MCHSISTSSSNSLILPTFSFVSVLTAISQTWLAWMMEASGATSCHPDESLPLEWINESVSYRRSCWRRWPRRVGWAPHVGYSSARVTWRTICNRSRVAPAPVSLSLFLSPVETAQQLSPHISQGKQCGQNSSIATPVTRLFLCKDKSNSRCILCQKRGRDRKKESVWHTDTGT